MTYETDKLARLAGGTGSKAAGYQAPRAPATVYLLAEHLDSALAAGEDMSALSFTWIAAPANPIEAQAMAETRRRIAQLRTLEISLIGHVMRAREHAHVLAQRVTTFRPVANLYLSGTASFADAVEELGQINTARFEAGGGFMSYLRSRGLIEAEAAAPPDSATLRIGEDFLIAKRIALGPLMDLVAMFLDTLEMHYTLFEDAEAPGASDMDEAELVRRQETLEQALARLAATRAAAPELPPNPFVPAEDDSTDMRAAGEETSEAEADQIAEDAAGAVEATEDFLEADADEAAEDGAEADAENAEAELGADAAPEAADDARETSSASDEDAGSTERADPGEAVADEAQAAAETETRSEIEGEAGDAGETESTDEAVPQESADRGDSDVSIAGEADGAPETRGPEEHDSVSDADVANRTIEVAPESAAEGAEAPITMSLAEAISAVRTGKAS